MKTEKNKKFWEEGDVENGVEEVAKEYNTQNYWYFRLCRSFGSLKQQRTQEFGK
jgi:hypothetical protein